MWTRYIVKSTEYTYQLSSWSLKKQMDNKTKINNDHETHYMSAWRFEEFILMHEAMNAEQGYLTKINPDHRGWIQIAYIRTDSAYCSSAISQTS